MKTLHARGGLSVLRRLRSGLLLAAMLLSLPRTARAAVIIDPGYRQGGQELELSLAYYTPSDTFFLHGDWRVSQAFSVSGHLEVNEGDPIYGYLEGFSVFGPIGLSYGLIQDRDDLFCLAGISGALGRETLGVVATGDVFYGEEEARGAWRAAALWQPTDGLLVLAGIYGQGSYILPSGIWLEEPAVHPYLYTSIRQALGSLELQGQATVILDLDYSFELSLLCPLGDRSGIGGIVSVNGSPDGSVWSTEYGVRLACRF